MYCKKCGHELSADSAFCSACGEPVTIEADSIPNDIPSDVTPEDGAPRSAEEVQEIIRGDNEWRSSQRENAGGQDEEYFEPRPRPQQDYYDDQRYQNPDDKTSIGFCILSFLIPIVGLILFLVWRKDKPKKAKGCIIAGAAGFVLGLIVQMPAMMNGSADTMLMQQIISIL
jgi:hypothetical protein